MNILKTLLFTIFVPGSVTLGVPYLLLTSTEGSFPPRLGILWPVGILLAIIGVIGYLWCAWNFATIGQGTPGPWAPPRHFVARGLYRFTRNPMYVSVLLIITGESVLFASLTLALYALIVWLIVHLFVIFYEEPGLRERFSSSYENYYRNVPRWIVPTKLFQQHR